MSRRLRCEHLIKTFRIIFFAFLLVTIFGNSVQSEGIELKEGDDLQKVINEAQGGETIFLTKGIYQGPITIPKSLTLEGEKGATIDGGLNGSVINVSASRVSISGLTIQNSGEGQQESGIYLDKEGFHSIENNTFKNVKYGIYINNSKNNKIIGNTISSKPGHFSTRGNGIHIFKGEANEVHDNVIQNVQDGIYFDFAKDVHVTGNWVQDSRYGLHYMFSQKIITEGNTVEGNITGMMVMDSSGLKFYQNQVNDQFHFRGFGILIYDSKHVVLQENKIVRNSVGISLEKADNTEIYRNVVAANQVGLEFRMNNTKNIFTENNFIANIVSSTIGKEEIELDNGEKGNYWDDYKSYDITGDGIGEIPYKAGSLYDNLLKQQPLWQFYFESPAIGLWSEAESMFPSLGSVEVYDQKPLVEPVLLTVDEKREKGGRNPLFLFIAIVFIGVSLVVIVKGRKYT